MLLPAVSLNLKDPTDVLPVNAYCRPAEITIQLEQRHIRCAFHCWKSEQAFLSNCKPFGLLPVTIKAEEGGSAILTDAWKNLLDLCDALCARVAEPDMKNKIEQNANKDTLNS
jgi:hypothetical protein